jgi:hypothetical protein
MPKKEIDYSSTIIYKIVCRDLNIKNSYVGHTTNFIKRKCNHKCYCNNKNSIKHDIYVYQFIRKNGGWENWNMIEIEKYECNDFNEACKRERYWIEKLKSSLNRVIPTRTDKEYYDDNKVQFKEYRDANKERNHNYHKLYYQENKNDLSEYYKKYKSENKDMVHAKYKIYYEKNKERMLQQQKEKVNCIICDCEFNRNNLSRHNRSIQHIKNTNACEKL